MAGSLTGLMKNKSQRDFAKIFPARFEVSPSSITARLSWKSKSMFRRPRNALKRAKSTRHFCRRGDDGLSSLRFFSNTFSAKMPLF
jgi:hypothetical protein